MAGFETVDEYVAAQPPTVQELLNRLRRIGLESVPGGVEAISYQIPTIKRDGINIVHFAAWKKHLAIYPMPEGDESFDQQMTPYLAGKGTLQFKYADPMPYDLITEVITRLAAVR